MHNQCKTANVKVSAFLASTSALIVDFTGSDGFWISMSNEEVGQFFYFGFRSSAFDILSGGTSVRVLQAACRYKTVN
jgi:hypothetical protein